jgi:hypothetical protein
MLEMHAPDTRRDFAADTRLLGIGARSDLIKPSLSLFDEEHNCEQFNRTPLGTLRSAFRRR